MIPRVLHRIWLGSPVREEHDLIWERWRSLFPDYELVTWAEAQLADVGLPEHFETARTFAEQSDIARLRVLNEVGGVYVDCDVEPLKRFDSLWSPGDRLVVFEESPGLICNGIVASAPGTLTFVERFVRHNARRHPPDSAPNVRTGPFAFTAALDYEMTIDPHGVRVYPPSFLDLRGGEPFAVARTRFSDPPIWASVPRPRSARPRVDPVFEARLLCLRGRRRLAHLLQRRAR